MIVFHERFLNVAVLQMENGVRAAERADDEREHTLLLKVLSDVMQVRHREAQDIYLQRIPRIDRFCSGKLRLRDGNSGRRPFIDNRDEFSFEPAPVDLEHLRSIHSGQSNVDGLQTVPAGDWRRLLVLSDAHLPPGVHREFQYQVIEFPGQVKFKIHLIRFTLDRFPLSFLVG